MINMRLITGCFNFLFNFLKYTINILPKIKIAGLLYLAALKCQYPPQFSFQLQKERFVFNHMMLIVVRQILSVYVVTTYWQYIANKEDRFFVCISNMVITRTKVIIWAIQESLNPLYFNLAPMV